MNITTIKNEEEYDQRLIQMEALIEACPETGSPDFEELELLGLIISDYEKKAFAPVPAADPVDVIEFFMDQNNLSTDDLEPYLGTSSRISEILNRKRELSKQMIKALHKGLGIPAEMLLREYRIDEQVPSLPIWELAKRGWVNAKSPHDAKKRMEELVTGLFEQFSLSEELQPAHYRRTIAPDQSNTQVNSLKAWQYLILAKATAAPLSTKFDKTSIDNNFVTQLRGLSVLDHGPKLAKELLAQVGIHLVFEEHFKTTRLDGAATMLPNGTPVIGMTLRHDRIDNFWFVLFHELAHVILHLGENGEGWFIDELDGEDLEAREKEADDWAIEHLLSETTRKQSEAFKTCKTKDVRKLAKQERINPAIIAGMIRKETKNYRILSKLVGYGKIREMFEEDLKPV